MRPTTLTALVLALGVSATTLEAQPGRRGAPDAGRRGGPPPAERPTGPRGDLMRAEASPAAMLLRQRERLSLTPEQVTRLETLAAAQRQALAPVSPAQQLRLRADLLDAMQGTGNPQAARAALDKMSAQRNERIVAGLRARQEAQAVLTPEQRAQADAMRRAVMRQVAGDGRDARGVRGGRGERGERGVRGPRGPRGVRGAPAAPRGPGALRGPGAPDAPAPRGRGVPG